MYREHTKAVRIGDRFIGGGHPITVQSMTNTKTEDAEATIGQILRLEEAGCEIIRSTVPTLEAAEAFALSLVKNEALGSSANGVLVSVRDAGSRRTAALAAEIG